MLLHFMFNGDDAIRRQVVQTGEPITQKIETILSQIGQRLCGLRGHQTLVHFEPNRMSLQCSRCGFESQGWHIGKSSAFDGHRSSSSVKARALVRVHGRLA